MIKLGKFRLYVGTKKWGWIMIGFGYDAKWFFGFSMIKN